MEKVKENFSFEKRLKSMLKVDFRRFFTTPLFYIMVGVSLVIPVLILVMTGMMDGMTMTDAQTGAVTVMKGFDNVWQIFGSLSSGGNGAMGMDITSMCNINMMYFAVAVLVCVFVSDDFRSGYAKNLFTVRAKKTDYIISKTAVGFVGSAFMLLAFTVGALIGGAVAGLPFDMVGFNTMNVIDSVVSKIFLSSMFVAIYVLASVIAKQRLWLSIILSLGIGMLCFTTAPIITPLDANFINVILCFAGGIGFAVGVGAISNLVLNKTALV
ncbi:MAG: ABC transporter permease [Clostridia bacterium]|nr:ABC transporter permease [Clostridia bacterium]